MFDGEDRLASTVAGWFAVIRAVTRQGVEPADMNAELAEINGERASWSADRTG
ncbi:hypothetical protein [Streptomyces sp. NPDC003480]